MKPVPALEEFIILQKKKIHPQSRPLNAAPFQSCPSLAFSRVNSGVLLVNEQCEASSLPQKLSAGGKQNSKRRALRWDEGHSQQAVLPIHCCPSLPKGEWRPQWTLLGNHTPLQGNTLRYLSHSRLASTDFKAILKCSNIRKR